MEELATYVIYDIPNDTIRTKIAEVCKDYGLERIQFSAFHGFLTRSRREELFLRLGDVLGSRPGKILVQPVCGKDEDAAQQIENHGHDGDADSSQADASGERPEAV